MGDPSSYLQRYADLIPDFDGFLAAVKEKPPLHVRINTLKSTPEAVGAYLGREGLEYTPEKWCPLLLRLEASEKKVGATLLHALGHIYIQSASSAVSALALAPKPGERVLDLCAAPGSKTSFLAQMMESRGALVANEPGGKRHIPLKANLRRVGASNILVTGYSGQNFPMRESFDKILVDAPCTGDGTWRGPDTRPREITENDRKRMALRQSQILERAINLMGPGAELTYSTCTYAPEENELVLSPLMEKYDLTTKKLGIEIPTLPGLTQWEGQALHPDLINAARIYPHKFDSEGFFVIRLVRR
ncbi:MAG: RNA methyltransferase [Deltaproteobacteria bacterium]|nr:MAG: RNA methyltransferase [Deltaproteobacteria bacterium]